MRLEQDFGELPMSLMYEFNTVPQVADFLSDNCSEQLLRSLVGREDAVSDGIHMKVADASSRRRQENGEPMEEREQQRMEIAVVGVSGRYPGSSDVEGLWRSLREGACHITEVPSDRWESRADDSGRWGAFLDDVYAFDAAFFNILPRDAKNMDPQERVFLENTWNLLQGAGYLDPYTHQTSTGVFVGTMYATYGRIGATGWSEGKLVGSDSSPGMIANRVSYYFDFHGPSFTVDSACSSSLTAVHLACESLRRGECRMAVAGGVNLILHRAHLAGLASLGMLAADGTSKVFDARADGFLPGEGVGAVLLKPLNEAVRDGDHVWGVIKASFVNTAGRTSGFTVPNPRVQGDLVSETMCRAGVDPSTVTYIEAHGTGTALGDPIELDGLSRALTVDGHGERTCAVGSLKSNIGHLEGAAGIAGLTKLLLQLKYEEIPPCAGLESVNPKIRLEGTPFYFPTEPVPWPRTNLDELPEGGEGVRTPRRAGVSAFGAGGANAHVVVEEYLPVPEPSDRPLRGGTSDRQAILLCARTPGQLRAMAQNMVRTLSEGSEGPSIESLAFTTQVGGSPMPERLAILASDIAELTSGLHAFLGAEAADGVIHRATTEKATAHLLDGEEGAAFIDYLIERRSIEKLARTWAEGVSVDWARLWPMPRPRRAALPPYPFERVQYRVLALDELAVPDFQPTSGNIDAPPVAPAGEQFPSPTSATEAVEDWLRMLACGFLLVEPEDVDVEADLMELGFDSISLIELVGGIGDHYGLTIDPTIVFDYPTLRAIAVYLVTEHADDVDRVRGGDNSL